MKAIKNLHIVLLMSVCVVAMDNEITVADVNINDSDQQIIKCSNQVCECKDCTCNPCSCSTISEAHKTKTIKRSESKKIKSEVAQHTEKLLATVNYLKDAYVAAGETTKLFREERSKQVDEKFAVQTNAITGGFEVINKKIDQLEQLINDRADECKTCFSDLKAHFEKPLNNQFGQSQPEKVKELPNKNILINSLFGIGFFGGSLLNYMYNDKSLFSHLVTGGLSLHGLHYFSDALRIQITKPGKLTTRFSNFVLTNSKSGSYLNSLGNLMLSVGIMGGAYQHLSNPDAGETAKFAYGSAGLGVGVYAGKTAFEKIKSKLNDLD